MKTTFGAKKLEVLTSKFIIQLASFLHDKNISDINVNTVTVSPVNNLNEKTEINFKDENNKDYKLIVSHAKDMSCSNWSLKS